jgi:hypothetical protein
MSWVRPREKKRDAILGHVASWGDRRAPMGCITAKPARAVNALADFAAIVIVGRQYARIRRGMGAVWMENPR